MLRGVLGSHHTEWEDMVKLKIKSLTGFAAATLMAGGMLAASSAVQADHTITIRIASGHPPTVVYAGLMKNFFQPELKKAIESKTSHKVNFIEGYSGSIVKGIARGTRAGRRRVKPRRGRQMTR